MLGTGAFIYWGGLHKGNFTSLIGIYIFYGFIMGIGLGTGYLSPVKTLMLWFSKQKGLATGLAVAGFGAAKAIASPIMQYMLDHLGDGSIYKMFFILSLAYFIFMFSGALLLKKPSDWHESTEHRNISNIISVIKTKPIKNYIAIWIMFYLNITCGLALLSQEKFIVQSIGLTSAAAIVSTFSAIFNAGGRLFFSAIADYMKDRNTVYKLIFALSALFTLLVTISGGIPNGIHSPLSSALTIILIMAINAGYGGGFANLAPLLSDYYGMKNISTLHGITLSAWAFAGLSGNQLASWIVRIFGETVEIGSHLVNPEGYQIVLNVTLILYAIALILSCLFVKQTSKKIID